MASAILWVSSLFFIADPLLLAASINSGIPCAVISAPFHVQDHPARYSPQVGWEGANVIFDTWVHPLVMGLEEHLLHMFREDFEFNDSAGPSHLGGHLNQDTNSSSLYIPCHF